MASSFSIVGLVRALATNFGLKVFSVALALVLYLFVTVESDATSEVEYPVEYVTDDDKVLIGQPPMSIRAVLTGPFAPFLTYGSDDLEPIVVDLRGLNSGTRAQRIDFSDVVTPTGLSVAELDPQEFSVSTDNKVVRELPISADVVDRPPYGFKITEVRLNPETVEVEGPEKALKKLVNVTTRPFKVDDRTETFDLEVELQPPAPPQRLRQRQTVATVQIAEEFVTRTFVVNVRVQCPEGTLATVQPSAARLSLRGPMRFVNQLDEKKIDAFVDITSEIQAGQRVFTKTVELAALPDRTGLVEMAPEVRVRVRRVGVRNNPGP